MNDDDLLHEIYCFMLADDIERMQHKLTQFYRAFLPHRPHGKASSQGLLFRKYEAQCEEAQYLRDVIIYKRSEILKYAPT